MVSSSSAFSGSNDDGERVVVDDNELGGVLTVVAALRLTMTAMGSPT